MWLVFKFRFRLYLLILGNIDGYYPYGQNQYVKRAVLDMGSAKKVVLVGARGLDLIGENSPIGDALRRTKAEEINIYLLHPDSENARLRVGHLEVERNKYRYEALSVQAYVSALKSTGTKINLYLYRARPVFRIIATEKTAYVAPYQEGVQGKRLPCFRIRSRSGGLYERVQAYLQYLESASYH